MSKDKETLKTIKENYETMSEKERLEKLIAESTYEIIKTYRNGCKKDTVTKEVKNEIS